MRAPIGRRDIKLANSPSVTAFGKDIFHEKYAEEMHSGTRWMSSMQTTLVFVFLVCSVMIPGGSYHVHC